ncbi:TonB-dependent receptor [Novosphingobium lentum]|uniref:TonB-dependent receptor n=1 Tax=Novosphingobium lentum TaxID=145287 RepID=UPI0008320C42|nr:TonB-dependent receptor [Novosphingobium lentum]
MRTTIASILAGTALWAVPAWADAPVLPAAEADAAADAGEGSAIIVFGKGETRQVSEISQADIAILAPGTTALKALDKLPSVNFQSADPFGAYEWSERITVRGFDQSRLGFTLDGIPLGNQNYGNNNGLHTSRAISPENVATTRLTQGAGSVGTQATNNLGGTIEIGSRDPSREFAIDANGSYGNHNTIRGFARIDTGGDTARAWLSYGYLSTDKWKGVGKQYQHQVNAKGVIDAGSAKITGFFDFSDRREQDYQDLSLDQIKRLGLNLDNIAGNFPLAVLLADIAANRGESGAPALNPAAGKVYPAPYGAAGTVDDSYFDASGLRRDYLGSLNVTAPLGDKVAVSLTGYYHNNHGQGTWFTPYVPSPSGVPISVRTTEYDIKRKGAFGDVTADLGWSNLTVGGWYERNDFHQARRFYALDSRTVPTRSALQFQANPFFTQWEFDYTTDIVQYYVQDKIALGAATIDLGWKGFTVKNTATPVIQAGRAAGSIKATDWFQPSVGVNYKLSDMVEAYASFSQSTEAYVSAFTAGPFSTTQAGFDAIKGTLKPESSDTYEVGARVRSGDFNASIGGYLVNFHNRLLGITTGAGIIGNPAVLQNVGGVRSAGVEAALAYKFGNGLSGLVTYSYNDATYRNDVVNAVGTVLAATAGKRAVDAPEHLAKAELVYDSSTLFGRVGVNYMSKRYFTYLNDQSVPGRALVDATLGYRFTLAGLRTAEIQLNASNLFDKAYISTIGSNGFGNSGDNQTLLAGSPRQVLVTLKIGL